MTGQCVKFMKILRAELEDLLEDINTTERRCAERFARREVTDYVFKQNDGLFRVEAESLRRLLALVQRFDCSAYADASSLAAAIDAMVRNVVRNYEEPEAIYGFVARKLEKVRRYVDSA